MKEKEFVMCCHELKVIWPDKDSVKRVLFITDEKENVSYLLSYYTIVAIYDAKEGKLIRTWIGYSPTTTRHIKLFAKFLDNKFTYFDWKDASRDDGKYLPLEWLTNRAREAFPLKDDKVNWWWR